MFPGADKTNVWHKARVRGVQEDLLECSGGERREATFLEGLLLAFYSPLPALVTGFLLPWRKFPTPSAAKQKKKKKIPSPVHSEAAAINSPWRAGDFHLGFPLKNK